MPEHEILWYLEESIIDDTNAEGDIEENEEKEDEEEDSLNLEIYEDTEEDAGEYREINPLEYHNNIDFYLEFETYNEAKKEENVIEKYPADRNINRTYKDFLDINSLYREDPPPVVKIKYDRPLFINNQWTDERIFIESREDTSLYNLTRKALDSLGIGIEAEYDERFDAIYVKAINGVPDGKGGMYFEAWKNGKIVENSFDHEQVRRGDFLEIRRSEERDFSCGGGYSKPEMEDYILGNEQIRGMIGRSSGKLDTPYIRTLGTCYLRPLTRAV